MKKLRIIHGISVIGGTSAKFFKYLRVIPLMKMLNWKMVIPNYVRPQILTLCHDEGKADHFVLHKTYSRFFHNIDQKLKANICL